AGHVDAQADAEVAAVHIHAVIIVFRRPVTGADEPVHAAGAAEVEARIRTDACVLDLSVGHAVVFGAVEPATRQLDADQRHGTGLPAIAGVDRQRGLIDVLVHPALATLHAEEETATVFFVARGHRLLRNVRR